MMNRSMLWLSQSPTKQTPDRTSPKMTMSMTTVNGQTDNLINIFTFELFEDKHNDSLDGSDDPDCRMKIISFDVQRLRSPAESSLKLVNYVINKH